MSALTATAPDVVAGSAPTVSPERAAGAGPGREDRVATAPPEERGLARDEVALVVASPGGVTVGRFTDLAEALRPGDLIVVNSSATLAASLPVGGGEGRLHLSTPAPGAPGAPPGSLPDVAAVRRWVVEVRRRHGWGSQPDPGRHPGEVPRRGPMHQARGQAARVGGRSRLGQVLPLSGGAHATLLHPYLPTPHPPTPHLPSRSASEADHLHGDGRSASQADRDSTGKVVGLPLTPGRDSASPPPLRGGGGGWGGPTGTRLWVAELDVPGDLLAYLDLHGSPIRYAYTGGAWPLAAYQTVFARDPGSAEMPSAGRPFSGRVLRALRRRGVGLAVVTLHTGVSSLEAKEPPYPEPYAISARTARAIAATRKRGGRVIAVGTTVTRALESGGRGGWTDLLLGAEHQARVVDGIISGLHPPGASHLALLEAVVGPDVVAVTYEAAREHALLWHEFGDSTLLLAR